VRQFVETFCAKCVFEKKGIFKKSEIKEENLKLRVSPQRDWRREQCANTARRF
jgi:hypothetical protein